MADSMTVARPYAKAIFEHALAENKLALWSEYLLVLTHAVMSPDVQEFLVNPATQPAQKIQLLQDVCAAVFKNAQTLNHLVTLLVSNKRLAVLPEIKSVYEFHRAEQEKTLQVDVASFSELSTAQQQKLVDSLSRKFNRSVALNVSIDPSLLGGAVIRAGDLVIDGSVRGKLSKLASGLAA